MSNKVVKVFTILLLMFVILPDSGLAARRGNKGGHSSYRVKRVSRVRRMFVPVHGALVQTLKGDVLLEQNSDQYFNPASVTKIATSLTALEQLGYDYRFNTEIYTNGKIQDKVLNGDLIVVASGDPGFFYENVFLIAESLNKLGIEKVSGNLLVTSPFYLNFEYSPQQSALQMKTICSAKRWTKPLQTAWERYLKEQNKPEDSVFQGVEIEGQARVISEDNTLEKHLLLTHQSRKLTDLLKIQNDYSSNFMATIIGRSVGGPSAIERFLVNKVGIDDSEVKIETACGLGENRITPNAALKVLRKFYQSVESHGKKMDELLPAAGVDEGTLEERFTNPELRGSVVAKTGTLLRQRVSALVGVAYTREKGPLFFALLDRDEVMHARRYQDQFVTNIIYQYGGPVTSRNISTNFESTPKIVFAK